MSASFAMVLSLASRFSAVSRRQPATTSKLLENSVEE